MPDDVRTLRVVADTLVLFAKGLDASAIPTIAFSFEHSPTDLPGVEFAWSLSVTLVGLREIKDDGTRVNAYERTWKVSQESPDAALTEMVTELRKCLSDETYRKMNELGSLNAAISQMSQASVDLQTLWPNRDPTPPAPEGTAPPVA